MERVPAGGDRHRETDRTARDRATNEIDHT